jgi:glycogen operon protein
VLDDAVFGSLPGRDGVQDHRDSAPYVPKSVVVHDAFPWGEDRRPRRAWADSVVYELHVKGFTAQHPEIPPELRGTYAGLAHPAAVAHLVSLGVTAVELMPVHHFVSEPHLLRKGLQNYWGYNSLAYFAPHAAYSASGSRGEQVRESRRMVRALARGRSRCCWTSSTTHTAEGDATGPTLSLRGIDNHHLLPHRGRPQPLPRLHGLRQHARRPLAARAAAIMDSLRYWVTEMHVDGFRFDLGLAR